MVTLRTKDYYNEILIAHEGSIVSTDTRPFPHWRRMRESPQPIVKNLLIPHLEKSTQKFLAPTLYKNLNF